MSSIVQAKQRSMIQFLKKKSFKEFDEKHETAFEKRVSRSFFIYLNGNKPNLGLEFA